jgi:DNA polymerase-1
MRAAKVHAGKGGPPEPAAEQRAERTLTHELKRLYLIDGNSYIYRAFHAIRNLANSKGFPTNAIYGFATMLLKIVREEKPDYLAVAFDTKGPTTRHAYFPQYKATRPPMPEGLVPQIPVIWDLVRAYRIPVIQQQGSRPTTCSPPRPRGLGHHLDVVLVSGDKDLLQLVGPHVAVLDTMKEQRWTAEEVEKRYGIGPERLVEMMALMGDAIDNVPGVRGVGEKTAIELVKQFGTLERATHLEQVKGGAAEALAAGREDAFLAAARDARPEVPSASTSTSCGRRSPHRAALAIFRRWSSRLVRELGAAASRQRRGRREAAAPAPRRAPRATTGSSHARGSGALARLLRPPAASPSTWRRRA